MTIELWALFVTGMMTFLTIFIQTNYSSLSYGMAHSLSNRDMAIEETALSGRLRRAAVNNVEALAMIAPLVIVAQLTGTSNAWTQYAAIAFMASRVLYLPAYAMGLVPARSIVWMLGFFALPFFAFGLI